MKEKLKGRRKLSKKDKEVVVYSGIGTVNLLCLGAIGYWSWKRYSTGTENGWKIIGIAAGVWAGITAFEWLSMRYVPECRNSTDFSALETWKHKDKSS